MAEEKTSGGSVFVLVKSVLLGLVLYLVLLVIADMVFLFTPLGEEWMPWAGIGVLGAGCFFAGIKAGNGMGKRGLLWGFVSASVIILILSVLVRFLGGLEDPSELSNIRCAACILVGCVGGMVGVNR